MTFKNFKDTCCRLGLRNRERGQGTTDAPRPLSETCHLGPVKVCKVTGDRRLCARMAALGVLPGQEVELVCPRQDGGQCLLKVHGSTLSLDQASLENILVSAP